LHHIPTVGFTWFPAWYWTILKYVTNASELIEEGYTKYKDRPFKFINLCSWVVVLNGGYLKDIRQATDDELSPTKAIHQIFKTQYTEGPNIAQNPYHFSFIRSYFARNVFALYNDIREEMMLAFNEVFDLGNNEWKSIPPLQSLQTIVCRATNRAIVGLPLCRDPDWIAINGDLSDHIRWEAAMLEFFPWFLLPLASYLTNTSGRIKRATKVLLPVINEHQKCMGKDEGWLEKPNDCLQVFLDEKMELTVSELAQRLMGINFPANGVLTQAFYNLAAYPQYVQPLREEVEAITKELGWTKEALSEMRKLDSFIKETMRLEGVSPLAMMRKALKDVSLSDGTSIPKGTLLVITYHTIHRNGAVYENPETFEPFRFAFIEDNAKQQLSASNNDWVGFGYGKHPCPGRFFASVLMKTMLAHVLLHYDFRLQGDSARSKSISMATTIMMDPTMKLMVRKRSL
ncbi:cytochrome P450, partial [Scleroderma citrinum]